MKRIGVVCHGFVRWAGGVDFLINLSRCLEQSTESLELHFIIPYPPVREVVKEFKLNLSMTGDFISCSRAWVSGDFSMGRERIKKYVDSIGNKKWKFHNVVSSNYCLRRISKNLELDALVPLMNPLKRQFPVPWVGYIYDFQHRYFPHFFSEEECKERDASIESMLFSANVVIVNSLSVKNDVEAFYPDHSAEILVLPFYAAPELNWLYDENHCDVAYHGKKDYFIVSNQFWKHKDHLTLFRAFAKISTKFDEVDLVCTGSMYDYRDPGYFSMLKSELYNLGIRNRVHFLGFLPKRKQISMMKKAVALIQPSLFEGGPGGGAVFDAVSLGLRCLVSDIPVNLELKESCISFFSAGDCFSLSQEMEACLENHMDGSKGILNGSDLIELGFSRQRKCANVILTAIEKARMK